MTVPFEPRPNDPDADHLNALLDAMRSGSRAPDAASTESPQAADLADAAGQLRGLVRRADAPAAAYLVDHPLQNRWEDIMSTAFPAAPPAAASGQSLTPSAPVSNRTRKLTAPPVGNRLNAWLSAAIVALMLLGTIGGAWWLGPGGSGPSNDGRTRLAAVTQDDATPEAEADFLSFIDPLECQSTAPMGITAYQEMIAEDRGIPEPEYGPVTEPNERDAMDAARVAREVEACQYFGPSVPVLRTESLMWREGKYGPSGYGGARYEERTDNARVVSNVLGEMTPDDLWHRTDQEPPLNVGGTLQVFMPEHAVQFEDGRIGIPASFLIPEDDATWPDSPPDWLFVWFSVLSNESGEWLLDDQLHICVGACDEFIAGGPIVFPEFRVFNGSPVASPQTVNGAPSKITDLLAAVPADMPGQEEGPNVGWTYADVEQQLANMGFTPEEAVADPLQVIGSEDFASIAWASGIFHYSTDEEFVAAIGFNPFMARQALGAFTFHDSIIVLRGDWDVDTLTAAWEAAGYAPYTTASGVTAWTIGPNGEIDPTHPIQSKGFQSLNNVAILDSGILVYAGSMETLELAIAAHAGEAQSARDDENIAPMLATVPEDTVSLVAFDQPGSAMFDLERQIEINPNIRPEDAEEMIEGIRAPLVESREAVGPMPDYHGVLFGITSESGENGGEVILRLGAASEEDAAQIATVIEWRWDNFLSARSLRPLNTVMTVTDATHEGTTAMLTFDPSGNPQIWRDLLHGNDLMPFAVDREDADASASPVATPES